MEAKRGEEKIAQSRMDLMSVIAHQNNLLEKVDRQIECGLRSPGQMLCDTGCVVCEIKMYLAGN